MSKEHAEEKKKKIVTVWNWFCPAFGFSLANKYIFKQKIMTEICSQTFKNTLKTHIEALKIKKNIYIYII